MPCQGIVTQRSIVVSLGAMCVCLFLHYATLLHIVICERCCHVCGYLSLDWATRQFRRVAKQFDDNVTMLCLAAPCKHFLELVEICRPPPP